MSYGEKSTHEIKIALIIITDRTTCNSTFMIERIITSDDTEIYKDVQSVRHTQNKRLFFSQFENWLNDYVSLEQCQHERAVVLEDDRNVEAHGNNIVKDVKEEVSFHVLSSVPGQY